MHKGPSAPKWPVAVAVASRKVSGMLAAAVSSRNQRTWTMWSWTRAMSSCWGPQVGSGHAPTQCNLLQRWPAMKATTPAWLAACQQDRWKCNNPAAGTVLDMAQCKQLRHVQHSASSRVVALPSVACTAVFYAAHRTPAAMRLADMPGCLGCSAALLCPICQSPICFGMSPADT